MWFIIKFKKFYYQAIDYWSVHFSIERNRVGKRTHGPRLWTRRGRYPRTDLDFLQQQPVTLSLLLSLTLPISLYPTFSHTLGLTLSCFLSRCLILSLSCSLVLTEINEEWLGDPFSRQQMERTGNHPAMPKPNCQPYRGRSPSTIPAWSPF